MKKLLVATLLVVLGIAVFSGGKPSVETRARRACENLATQCDGLVQLGGDEISADDIDECTKDLALAADEEGVGEHYDELTSCMADAGKCGEALGCVFGAFLEAP